MALISMDELLRSGVHFGHRVSRWNPKMEPYIFGKRNLIHIIDLRETVRGLVAAHHFLKKTVAEGSEVLFVCTKRQGRSVIEQEARRCGMHYVSERWIGGTLTNFDTIRLRLSRLLELEQFEEDGTITRYSKKERAAFAREKRKLKRNLEGIRDMRELPGVLVVVDPRRERIAVAEAYIMRIPTVALIDTDGDPEKVSIPIPGNDDAMRVIQIIVEALVDAVELAKTDLKLRLEAQQRARQEAEERYRKQAEQRALAKQKTAAAQAAAAEAAPAQTAKPQTAPPPPAEAPPAPAAERPKEAPPAESPPGEADVQKPEAGEAASS